MRVLLSILLLALATALAGFARPHLEQGTDEYRVGAGLAGAAAAGLTWALLVLWPIRAIRIIALVLLGLSAAAFFPPWLALSDTATTFFYGVLLLALAGGAAIRGLRGAERKRRVRFIGIALILSCLAAAAIGGNSAGRGIALAILFAIAFVLIGRKNARETRMEE